MITAANLSETEIARHLFFTRQGGVSDGIYGSLNCGPGSDDIRENVIANRARAMAAFGLEPEALVTVHQYHSPEVVLVEEPWTVENLPRADAMVTSVPGIALGILTADCAPVLFADMDAGVIGAAHAGWKGTLGGVLDATIESMVHQGASLDTISAAVGPCIAQPSYEVGPEFRTAFLETQEGNSRFFAQAEAEGKYQFDLPGYVVSRLHDCGLTNVDTLGLDTYVDEERFFSYRRATHRNEPDYGRELSAIVLEEQP